MSKCPKDCAKPKIPKKILTSKPFCDCRCCTCQNCPDILRMLSITVTDTTCHFASKVRYNDNANPDPDQSTEAVNLLDIINQDRSCNCDVVARGVRDNVHMNLGLSEHRDKITQMIDTCEPQCKSNLPESSTKTDKTKNAKAVPDKKTSSPKNAETSIKRSKCKLCDSLPRD